jgi:uncharacterized protein YpbB
VRRWKLIEERDTGYKVDQRGTHIFIRPATGRKFFTNEQQLWEYLRLWVQEALASAIHKVDDYTKAFNKLVVGDRSAIEINTIPDDATLAARRVKKKQS